MTRVGGSGGEDGQILPGLVMLLLAILALGVVGFQIGKAAMQRSQAQTAADAAALAGAREIKRQLEQQWATFGTTDISAIDKNLVVARMREYADRNGGRLDPENPPEIDSADVRVWVETLSTLGKDARGRRAGGLARLGARTRRGLARHVARRRGRARRHERRPARRCRRAGRRRSPRTSGTRSAGRSASRRSPARTT